MSGRHHAMRNTLVLAHAIARHQRFEVDTTRPDGATEHSERTGGTSIEHAQDGMERAGLGGVVRVRVGEQQ